jgi:hypothetical protein
MNGEENKEKEIPEKPVENEAEDETEAVDDFNWDDIDAELEKTASNETLDDQTFQRMLKQERTARPQPVENQEQPVHHKQMNRREQKKEQKWESREAEIDAMISRKQYGLKGLLLHPYKCMVNEFYEEIPGSFIGSLLRMFVKWLICGMLFAEEIKKMLDAGSFSYLRMNFSTVAAMGVRVALMLCAAELILYLLHCILSLFSHRKIGFHRVLSSGTMIWLWESIGYIIAGVIGMRYDPIFCVLVMFAVVLIGLMLKNQALIDGTGLSHEIVTVVSVLVVFVCAFLVVKAFGMSETQILKMLLQMYS